MEIKINKEIKQYKESVFFGLSLRQFVCAVGAVAMAIGIYFALRDTLGRETVSWVCIVCAAPVAAAGFFRYNDLTFEQFVFAFFKSKILLTGRRVYKAENFYYTLLKGAKKHD